MIQNSRQYFQARRRLGRWTALKSRLSKMAADLSIDDRELMAFIDERINITARSLRDYQTLQRLDFEGMELLRQVASFPASLIKARIALGWTQTELAKRIGLKAQHVHRYEKSGYTSIKLSRAIGIALLLHAALSDRAAAVQELADGHL